MARVHHVADYLEVIYFLANPIGEYGPVVTDGPVPAARVAEMLEVTPPTASEMLKRLEADGLVKRGPRRGPLLTEKGQAEARRVVRKHRIIERFLTDFMGYTAAESHEHADELGDAFSDEMVERMTERLGHPDRCPHGWPIDTDHELEENGQLRTLADTAAGDRVTIVRLAEHDGELLHWFYDQGYVPSTTVSVDRVDEAAGQLALRMGDDERSISAKAASSLFVRVES
jgi:DtxR family Mn-dependent transcriptional regulator